VARKVSRAIRRGRFKAQTGMERKRGGAQVANTNACRNGGSFAIRKCCAIMDIRLEREPSVRALLNKAQTVHREASDACRRRAALLFSGFIRGI